MASKPSADTSRRTSVASLFSVVPQTDKEALSQALDQIHTTASQTGVLTTFSQFTAPPSSSSGTEAKGIATDLQGGLSGLYSRFRASVGGVKDLVAPALVAGDSEADDTSSTKSNRTPISTPTSSVKQASQLLRHSSPSASAGTVRHEGEQAGDVSQLQSTTQIGRTATLGSHGQASAVGKDNITGSAASSNVTLPQTGLTKSAHPLAQAGPSSAIQPAVVEVNISATTNRDLNNGGAFGTRELVSDKPSKPTPDEYAVSRPSDTKRIPKAEDGGSPRIDLELPNGLRSGTNDYRPPRDLKLAILTSESITSTPRRRESDKRMPRRMTRISEVNGDTRGTTSSGDFDNGEHAPPKQSTAIALDGSTNVLDESSIAIASRHLPKSTSRPETGANPSAAQEISSEDRLAPPRSRPILPGFSLSRGSSTDTAGGSSVATDINSRSIYRGGSGDEVVQAPKILPPKAAATTQTSGDPRGVNVVLSQIKSKVLSKEYWMRDENAKDCFYCGDLFSTFRRKHHCRTCGQIFDAKCTSLVSGKPFGQSGSLRVCKPCEVLINNYDDSSEFSDDGSTAGAYFRARHGSKGASEASPARSLASRKEASRESNGHAKPSSNAVPTMAIPATRRIGDDLNRRSAVVEIDAERRLPRPGSSRSLKSSGLSVRQFSTHKRHHSRNLLQRGMKHFNEEAAPFHRDPENDSAKTRRLPAFHSDNIIDPDLAAFLSNDESTDEEQLSIMSALNGDGMGRSVEHDRNALSGFFASTKKSRSRVGDKSVSGVGFANRDPDEMRLPNTSRNPKRRNLSISSNIHLRPSPRNFRFSNASPAMSTHLQESFSSSALDQLNSPSGGLRMIRSSSMKGADAPVVELNAASIQHVRKLLRQLLQDFEIPNVNSWEKALMPILLQATDDVNPDVQNGDDIDIRHYVKLKKIPGGRPGDTSYVSGLVFTKNLALKSMPRSIAHPNILILTFPLEYARHQQHFMSLEPVIRQEREFLQNLVHRIAALRPQLLLVARNVSGLALEFLEQANIATAYNVKSSVLEAIARCSQSRIISSIDKLAIKSGQASRCASFYLKTYVHGGRKKTYMYLSGCPKELGCTVVLRGGENQTLAKIKRVTEFMTYVVYNLKLETCLMRDEFALIPSYTSTGSISPDKRPCEETDHEQHLVIAGESTAKTQQSEASQDSIYLKPTPGSNIEIDEIQLPEDIPKPTFYSDMVEKHNTKILSASPFVKFMQPYLLMRAREQEQRLLYLKNLCDQDAKEGFTEDEASKPQKFVLIKPEMIHENFLESSKKFKEVLHAVHDAEYDKALHKYRTQKKQWEAYISGNTNLFDPFAHQNIAVLYSVVCTVTTVPCSGPDLLALGFYNEHEIDQDFEADCTLGQYVEDLCLGANTVCTANGCERKMFEHHRQYVHGSAQLSVTVEHHPCELRGLQDSILMWSVCRVCDKSTQVMPMSDNTWKYSFGKYLELSFWSSELHARADVCPHDLHRDHFRYFGFKDIALRVQYDPINILEISVPRTRITWKVRNDLQFKNEVFIKTEERINKFMLSVKARIKSIKLDSVIPEKVDSCKEEIERLMKRAVEEHQALIRKLQEKYMDSKYFEIIPLNRAIRATQEKVAEWDNIFAEFDNSFFPSEKDIRRLATIQLKKIFLDRDDSVSSLGTTDEGTPTPPSMEGEWPEKQSPEEMTSSSTLASEIPPETARDILKAAADNDTGPAEVLEHHKSAPATSIPALDNLNEPGQANAEDFHHLGLAVSSLLAPPSLPEKAEEPYTAETRPVSPTTSRGRPETKDDNAYPVIFEPLLATLTDRPTLKEAASSSTVHSSSIPRPSDPTIRRMTTSSVPGLQRMQSQPAPIRSENMSFAGPSTQRNLPSSRASKRSGDLLNTTVTDHAIKHSDRKLSDRLTALKTTGQSMIPRSIASRRKDSRVSALAKHFEQLSREFEKERLRERRQLAAKSKQARAYPVAASKPIVEVYRNVHEAVEEREASDDESSEPEPSIESLSSPTQTTTTGESSTHNILEQTPEEGHQVEDTAAEDTAADDTAAEDTAAETDDNTHVASYAASDAEEDAVKGEEDHAHKPERQDVLSPSEAQLDLKLDLPKHEKSSLMKMLTNFWAERSASGWQALDYPLIASDHVFADSDVIIREDEPSSLIAFALGSEDYKTKLQSIQERSKDLKVKHNKKFVPDSLLTTEEQKRIECSLLQSTGTHLKYQFQEGSAKMLCKIFYAEQFDAVRRKCGVTHRIVESLSRCAKWDSKGGKTKSVFLKTLDDRLVLKSLSQIETQAFLRFAPAYFQLMAEALFHELPSVIAKMVGFYQIIIKNPVTGVEFNWFLLVMENLFYDRCPTRIFDLKGSMRNRRIQSTGEQNEVLLDENMVEFIYESPLFVREHSKRLIRSSVWNDTLFLARQSVMDYSLMIAIDENRKELVVGMIDCIRTYTWDKKLESWLKDRGKNRPTVTSPKEYKNRFREAMERYVLQAPNCWHQFQAQLIEPHPLRYRDRSADMEAEEAEGEVPVEES
ncbi:1-phosphatidylinositol-3-phosphate 5-kinase [Trapelia coarctata]|nr:1-phosphatidylinositol-3-phosphate 5-kinase [Trapelia coarctata]